MTLLNALDRDIEIVIRAKPLSRAVARISVVAVRCCSPDGAQRNPGF